MLCRLPPFVTLALLGLALAPAATAQTQLDQVVLRGQPAAKKGLVKEITKDEVTLEINGAPQTFGVNEILRINFADEPIELNNARNAIATGKFALAMEELKKLDGKKPQENRNVAADIGYYKAYCLARHVMNVGGDRAVPLTKLLDWAKAFPTSYHFYEAAETLGDLSVASGDFAKAATYYGSLAGSKFPDLQMRGNIAVGRALLSEKKFPEALQKFEAVIASSENTAGAMAQKQLANVGRAVCLAETGKPDEGVAILNAIIKDNSPEDDKALFARTYTALGNCYLKQGKTKEALQAFLFTDILFDVDPDAHAEALYHLSKLWDTVNKSERAKEAKSMLIERYAGSVWAGMN